MARSPRAKYQYLEAKPAIQYTYQLLAAHLRTLCVAAIQPQQSTTPPAALRRQPTRGANVMVDAR